MSENTYDAVVIGAARDRAERGGPALIVAPLGADRVSENAPRPCAAMSFAAERR